MKQEDRVILRFSIAVSIRCNAIDNPLPESPTPEQADAYIRGVLEVLFEKTGLDIDVQPLVYPACGKFPLIIRLADECECLFWFYPYMEPGTLAVHLEESLNDLFCGTVRIPA